MGQGLLWREQKTRREIEVHGVKEIAKSVKWAALTVPYLAVAIGLHWLGSVWITLLLYHSGMLAVLIATRFDWRELARGWQRVPGIMMLLVCATAGLLLVLFSGWLFPDIGLGRIRIDSLGIGGSAWIPFLIYYILATPVLEEAFWRGTLGRTRKWFDVVDLIFAGYHVGVLILFVPPVAIILSFFSLWGAAMLWRLVRHRLGGLLVPVLTHFVADLSIMLGLHYLLSQT